MEFFRAFEEQDRDFLAADWSGVGCSSSSEKSGGD